MDKTEAQALQVAKEVAIKFIEVGRISPNNFAEFFAEIYSAVLSTVGGAAPSDKPAAKPAARSGKDAA